ncbi:MAG: AAA family ATPase [SAR324 cluster bacterium]|nr:AAA family ATPase [SAR324 cluster bacterium]
MKHGTINSNTDQIEEIRSRINNLRQHLASYYVGKQDILDLMVLCTFMQEPLLLVGKPGTAKSDLVVKFCQALSVGKNEYFEYMLTKFTEPSEILGPVDIKELKEGKYIRNIEGKLPTAKIVFLDEVFKSNSAILNTLLTLINERKFYQNGQPHPVPMIMLFGATNEIPEFSELAALRDRFTLKVESMPVQETHFEELIVKGLQNDAYKIANQRPWEGKASLEDFIVLKQCFDEHLFQQLKSSAKRPDQAFFPEREYTLFKHILKTLQKENQLEVTDRKVIKLYKLIRARAYLEHGGVVKASDLGLLQFLPDKLQDFEPVAQKINKMLGLS